VLWRLRGMVRTMRPHQWVKNLFVLAPVVFAHELNDPTLFIAALGAFAVFCLLAGSVYTLNDLVDADADRVHPVKRFRPIASGRVPVPVARAMVVVLVVGSLGAALTAGLLYHRLPFFVVALLYFLQNVAYSFRLKKVAYLDVGFIALGFVLRVLAGGYATLTPVSGYLIACTALISLFQGFGKRRHELLGAAAAKKQRAALEAYSPRILTVAMWITGIASVAAYLAYTLDPPAFFHTTHWLWLTTVHPLFGVIRFMELVVGRPKAESPTQEMLRDVPFMLNLVLWIAEILAIVGYVRFE
jgi:decaprenyl-phosphate phosphoribosyltransferase